MSQHTETQFLGRRLSQLESRLEQEITRVSKETDDLKAAYEANKAEVASALSALQAKIKDLTDKLANDPGDVAALQAITAEITADTAALHAGQQPSA